MGERFLRLRDFHAELRRRRVYRTAVLYIVVAAGTVELVDIVLPYTRLPGWTVGFVFVLAACGLPIVLVLAWTFDVRAGIESTVAAREDAAGGRTREEPAPVPTPDELDVRSVAVLPFETLSGVEEVAPLAAGLHDDLLTALSKVPALTVISRTSVKAYRGTEKRVSQIARELNVGTVLEGAVQSAAGRVRLNVQLIDARHDVHRWAETYDRELSPENIFQIQSDLTKRIVESLHAELARVPQDAVEGPATDDLEAYRLYAQGRTWLDQRTEDALSRALSYFRRAIERDPEYAPAWAGVAETLALTEWYDYPLPEDAPDPWHAARRARELDPMLAEAHASLGILHSMEQAGPAALESLTRAIELRPGDAEARLWLAWLLLALGRPGSALEASRRSVELNPLSVVVHVFAAETALANGHPSEALDHARRATQLQPRYGLAHFMDGLSHHHLGHTAEARDALTRALSLVPPGGSPSHTQIRGALAVIHAAAGDLDETRRTLSRIEEATGEMEDPFAAGLAHAALGEADEAFEAFGRVGRWRGLESEQIRYLFPDVLGPLREDPRWEGVLRAVDRSWGLED